MAPFVDTDDTMEDRGENPDEWIRVTRKKGRKPSHQYQTKGQARTPRKLGPTNRTGESIDDVVAQHNRITTEWRSSKCCQDIQSLITAQCAGRPSITRAVCLGVGSVAEDEDGYRDLSNTRSVHVQIDAFLVIVEILSKLACQRIPCIFQEPVFTPKDVALIESLGHTVVEDPAAFDLIDSSTFVYGVHLYYIVWRSAWEREIPAMMVGNDFNVFNEIVTGTDRMLVPADYWDKIDEVEGKYEKNRFPQDGDYYTFSDTAMYLTPKKVVEVESVSETIPVVKKDPI